MVSPLKISDEVYDRLLVIKQEFESKATQAAGTKAKVTFSDLLVKILDVYQDYITIQRRLIRDINS